MQSTDPSPWIPISPIIKPRSATSLSFSGLEFKTHITNSLGVDVHVTTRDGLTYTLPPDRNNPAAFNCVRVTYGVSASHDVNFDSRHIFSAPDDDLSDMQKELKSSYVSNFSSPIRTKQSGCCVEIGLNDFKRLGGNVYVKELDVCISINEIRSLIPHPYSHAGQVEELQQTAVELLLPNSFGYNVVIVDNESVIGDRFVNFGGKIFKIQAVRDELRDSAVYITSIGDADCITSQRMPLTQKYPIATLDQTCPFLYRSVEEAKHYGDVIARKEEELKRLVSDNNIITAKLKRDQTEWEIKLQRLEDMRKAEQDEFKLKRERESALLKEEADKLEHQRKLLEQERKDHYERRSYERKDSSESWKFIPAIATGVIAVIALLRK